MDGSKNYLFNAKFAAQVKTLSEIPATSTNILMISSDQDSKKSRAAGLSILEFWDMGQGIRIASEPTLPLPAPEFFFFSLGKLTSGQGFGV